MQNRTSARLHVLSALAVGAGLVGCTGSISTGSDDPRATDSPRAGNSGTGGPRTGGSNGPGSTGGMGVSPDVTPAACGSNVAPPLMGARVWRLSAKQFANTVKQVFGVDADVSRFPLDGVADDLITTFDTNADTNLVTDQFAEQLQTQARAIADAYVAKISTANACVTGAAPASTCAPGFWTDVASRAYRRPLQTSEVDRLVALWNAARAAYDSKTATRMTVEAIVQAPSFLYRSELGEGPGAKVALTQHELATQLSYVLADVPPDDALRAAADKAELTSPAALRPHADRLIKLPSARAKLETFFATYLGLKGLIDGKTKDATKYPMFTDAFKATAVADALAQVGKITFDGAGTLEALWSAKIDLGSALASVYGAGTTRPGLIAHPAVMAGLSNESTTSPVHRGMFLYKTMLCGVLPPPPANASTQIEKLSDPTNPNATQREQWAYFQKASPACASCHKTFQPMGLGLENYDPIGRHRTEEFGKPIDPSIDVANLDADLDGRYGDAVALASRIAGSDRGRTCFGLQLTTFAYGRSIEWDDPGESCRLRALADRFAGKSLDVRGVLLATLEDEGFFFRRYE